MSTSLSGARLTERSDTAYYSPVGMTRLLAILAVLLLLATPVAAQDFAKGLEAYKRGDYEAALREWRPLAEQGDASAQHALGVMNYRGDGVSRDYSEALKWFRKAAEQGNAGDQYNLGLMYDYGLGAEHDSPDDRQSEQNRFGIQRNLDIIDPIRDTVYKTLEFWGQ